MNFLNALFPVLNIMKQYVRATSPPHVALANVRAIYAEALRILRRLVTTGGPAGRAGVAYWISRMTFSIEALKEADLLCRCGQALHRAVSARKKGNDDVWQEHSERARELYHRALTCGEVAVTAAASQVRDASDRGGIAGYYHLLIREVKDIVKEYTEEVMADASAAGGSVDEREEL